MGPFLVVLSSLVFLEEAAAAAAPPPRTIIKGEVVVVVAVIKGTRRRETLPVRVEKPDAKEARKEIKVKDKESLILSLRSGS